MISSDHLRLLPFARHLLIGITAAYVCAVLSLGGTSAARPTFYALAAGWCAFLVSGRYWLCKLLSTVGERGIALRLLHVLELVGFNLSLILVLAEVSLRIFVAYSGNSLLLSEALDAHRLVPGRDYGGGLRGNSLGYPGREFRREKPRGVFRIAALGDSFAVGPAVPFNENYLSLLEQADSGIEVYNFGVSGAGPREYYAVLKEHVWDVQPDLVLVCVFVGNDITESLATPRHLDPRQHALYLLITRVVRLVRERERFSYAETDKRSDRLTASTLSVETFREVEARRLAVCLKAPPPSLEKKWQRALSYLDRIVRDCNNHDVPVAFVLIPDEFQVNPDVLAEALGVVAMDASTLDLEYPQRRLGRFCAERGVRCLDLRPAFAEVPNAYALRDTHWNARGNRLAADRIGPWLKTLKEWSSRRQTIAPRSPVSAPLPPAP